MSSSITEHSRYRFGDGQSLEKKYIREEAFKKNKMCGSNPSFHLGGDLFELHTNFCPYRAIFYSQFFLRLPLVHECKHYLRNMVMKEDPSCLNVLDSPIIFSNNYSHRLLKVLETAHDAAEECMAY